MKSRRVLAVDLDGTLVRNDLIAESFARLMLQKPHLAFFALFFLLIKGKAAFKIFISNCISIEASLLPFRQAVLSRMQAFRKSGGEVWLVTGTPRLYADSVATYLGCIDRVLATEVNLNLTGAAKVKLMKEELGDTTKVTYVGNSKIDLGVIAAVGSGTIMTNRASLAKACLNAGVEVEFESVNVFKLWLKHFRIHQWAKNLLIFVPLFTAHQLGSQSAWVSSALAFLIFSLTASSTYGINDLLDVWNDRSARSNKRFRPVSSGMLDGHLALLVSFVVMFLAFSLAALFLPNLLFVLVIYLVLTLAYSLGLKRITLLDVLLLSTLYLIRLVGGAVAIGAGMSFWILAFSIFLFFSLALLKRYSELNEFVSNGKTLAIVPGRGYIAADLSMVRSLGVSSGLISTVIFALYINDPSISKLYSSASILWLALPVLLTWISWLWLKAGRSEMNDDPIFFALRDRFSQVSGILLVILFLLATLRFQ